MFENDSKKALKEKIVYLEDQLAKERAEHENQTRQLQQLHSQKELQQKAFTELQEACAQKLQEIEQQKKDFEQKRSTIVLELKKRAERQKEELDAEAREARTKLEQELQETREQEQKKLQSQVKAFCDSYNYYLSQLKMMMDALTVASVKTGESLFADDAVDNQAAFAANFNQELLKDTVHEDAEEEINIKGE